MPGYPSDLFLAMKFLAKYQLSFSSEFGNLVILHPRKGCKYEQRRDAGNARSR